MELNAWIAANARVWLLAEAGKTFLTHWQSVAHPTDKSPKVQAN